eukprot:7298368-Alexandrium_andersonii.AAC.1
MHTSGSGDSELAHAHAHSHAHARATWRTWPAGAAWRSWAGRGHWRALRAGRRTDGDLLCGGGVARHKARLRPLLGGAGAAGRWLPGGDGGGPGHALRAPPGPQ